MRKKKMKHIHKSIILDIHKRLPVKLNSNTAVKIP